MRLVEKEKVTALNFAFLGNLRQKWRLDRKSTGTPSLEHALWWLPDAAHGMRPYVPPLFWDNVFFSDSSHESHTASNGVTFEPSPIAA